MIQFGDKSETAKNNDKEGVETDPFLKQMADRKGIDIKKILTSEVGHLTREEITQIFLYSSAILTKELERMMIEQFRSNRPKLNQLLFNHNARAATKIAHRYYGKFQFTDKNAWRYTFEDFLSSARFGLWNAAQRFDLDKIVNGQPIKFLTFATPWMFRYISDMLYESEGEVEKVSLDAPAYGNEGEDMELSEMIGVEDLAVSYTEANSKPVLEDEENEVEVETDVDEKDIDHGTVFDDDDEDTTDEKIATKYINALQKLVKNEDSADYETVREAIDQLCNTICKIKDPEERLVTLFISKRYLYHGMSRIGENTTKSMTIVKKLLNNIPGSRSKLFDALHLTEESFGKLCNKYAAAYSRIGA